MFRREQVPVGFVCPTCGAKLTREGNLLRCAEHGVFFAYGPQLLVRAARQPEPHPASDLPWEKVELRRLS